MPYQIIQNNCYPSLTSEVETCVISVDVLRSYSKSQKSLKIAVSILDRDELPMIGSDVSLVLISPDGRRLFRNGTADHLGIAMSQISGLGSGFWDIIVSNVSHPFFKLQFTRNSQRLLMVEV